MPDFPSKGASAAEVAAAILVDPADKIEAHNIDAAITTRSTLTQAQIISDSTPFLGASVAAILVDTGALPTDPADQSLLAADIAAVKAKADKIQDFLEEGTGTLTATGAEDTVRIYTGTGKLHCYIDLTNMVAGNSTTIRQYMTIKTAGSYIKYAQETYADVQTLPLLHIAMKPGKFGVKITLQQAAVVYKTYDWETLVEQAAA